jgi:hypothetical protein
VTEAFQGVFMELAHDKVVKQEYSRFFGKYIGTYYSARGQVRADLFDDGSQVVAHICFPTGLSLSTVEDRFVTILRKYAASQGFADRFRMVFSDD